MLNELPRNRVDRPSSLHFGRLAAQSSKAAHSPQLLTESAGAKRRISARGGEWGEQTLQQACSQAYPGSAICVQSFDDSLNSAIRTTYRISLRSSSLREPRYPLLKVVSHSVHVIRRTRREAASTLALSVSDVVGSMTVVERE